MTQPKYPLYSALTVAAVITTVAVLATGCAGTTDAINNAGNTEITYKANTDGSVDVAYKSGKEYEEIEANVDRTNGSASVRAGKVRNLEQIRAAAAVEIAFADFYKTAAPEVRAALEEILKSVRRTLILGPVAGPAAAGAGALIGAAIAK
jgi:hypothetical protein